MITTVVVVGAVVVGVIATVVVIVITTVVVVVIRTIVVVLVVVRVLSLVIMRSIGCRTVSGVFVIYTVALGPCLVHGCFDTNGGRCWTHVVAVMTSAVASGAVLKVLDRHFFFFWFCVF